MRSNLGGIATLCVGACFVWSCQGDIGSDDPGSYPGGKGGANGAATQPASGSAGHPATGAAGHAATGAAGHAGSGSATTQPTSGAAGQPATGGSAGQPDTGAAGQAGGGSVAPPVSGAAGEPATGGAGQAGSGSVAPPVSGAAGEPATGAAGQAGTGSAVPPATGAAGQPASGSAGAPATGATGQAGASVAPPVGGAGGAPAMPATGAASTIVPLYTSPGDPSWNAVIAAKMAHPKVGVVAIVNPSNGPGGSVSSAYASGIAKLTAAGIRVIGYVATGYTANSPASVKADIDRWKSFYPGQITGIFFDEQSNKAGDVPYYRDLSQYTKAQGLSLTVGNPGTDTAEGFVGALDMMLIYESAGLPSQAAMGGWHANYPPSNFGIIPYASSLDATFVHNARKYVQYIYVQSDNLPNPWDSVPTYFADLLAALE